jgi:hypothetical protein
MILTRRGFLAGLASIPVAVAAGDLLWVPGQKVISLPSPGLAIPTADLNYTKVRRFVSVLSVQMYNESPLMSSLIQRANLDHRLLPDLELSTERMMELDAMVERYLPSAAPLPVPPEFKGLRPLPMTPVDIWKRA